MAGRSILNKLLNDPSPRVAFEISEAGLAVGHITKSGPQTGFQPLERGTVAVSPVEDNIRNMEAFSARVQALAPRGEKKRQRAAVILPDFTVRVVVLDFDAFPPEPDQQIALIRFRVKKILPFDVEAAAVSYLPQPDGNGKRTDVVVAVAPMEILARYESPFRAAGFHPGLVTTSALCAVEMAPREGVQLMAKMTGRALTLAVLHKGRLKLMRSIELSENGGVSEIAAHLYPTFAYMEDQLGAKPDRVLTCGFGAVLTENLAGEIQTECATVRSRFGMPDQFNAGLLGYLESMEELQ